MAIPAISDKMGRFLKSGLKFIFFLKKTGYLSELLYRDFWLLGLALGDFQVQEVALLQLLLRHLDLHLVLLLKFPCFQIFLEDQVLPQLFQSDAFRVNLIHREHWRVALVGNIVDFSERKSLFFHPTELDFFFLVTINSLWAQLFCTRRGIVAKPSEKQT